jgi:hypothetical protein
VKGGGRKAVGGCARRESTKQYGNEIMKTGSQKSLHFGHCKEGGDKKVRITIDG